MPGQSVCHHYKLSDRCQWLKAGNVADNRNMYSLVDVLTSNIHREY